jgi:hypothetical protein
LWSFLNRIYYSPSLKGKYLFDALMIADWSLILVHIQTKIPNENPGSKEPAALEILERGKGALG